MHQRVQDDTCAAVGPEAGVLPVVLCGAVVMGMSVVISASRSGIAAVALGVFTFASLALAKVRGRRTSVCIGDAAVLQYGDSLLGHVDRNEIGTAPVDERHDSECVCFERDADDRVEHLDEARAWSRCPSSSLLATTCPE